MENKTAKNEAWLETIAVYVISMIVVGRVYTILVIDTLQLPSVTHISGSSLYCMYTDYTSIIKGIRTCAL